VLIFVIRFCFDDAFVRAVLAPVDGARPGFTAGEAGDDADEPPGTVASRGVAAFMRSGVQ
jgi:hypothetical protein